MKILCDRTQLQEAFALVSSVVPIKSTRPVLANVRLQAGEGELTLYATDLELTARVKLDAVKVSRKGTALLPARETAALLRELSDPTVTLETTEQRTRIEGGGGSFVLLGEDPEQYPQETPLGSEQRVAVPAERMLRMVQETAFAAAREETRYAINGVLMDLQSGCLRLVATDGRRLSLSYQNLDGGKTTFRAVVPLRVLATLGRAIPEGSKDDVQVSVTDTGKQIRFSFGRVVLDSQLLESRFPDYEGVIPKAAETSVAMNRPMLESCLRRAAILTSDDLRMVRFQVAESTLKITAESSKRGRAEVAMDVKVKGAGGGISFNPDYILEALRQSEQEEVRLDMSDDSMPAKFTLGESFTYVVMPISGT